MQHGRWPSLDKVNVLNSAFMDVDEVASMTTLNSRRRLQTALTMIFGDDPCRILQSNYLINARVPPVNSASDSIMVIADVNIPNKIAHKDVIFKITFKSKTRKNQYEIEALVYRILGEYPLPFVMQLYNTYYCPTFSNILKKKSQLIDDMTQRWTKLKQNQSQFYDFEKAQIMVSERGGGHSLFDTIAFIRQNSREAQVFSEEDWIAIFMQVMFCLAYFEELGIMHHDLHLGNVWLDQTDEIVHYSLYITKNANPIVFNTRYIVKIYDFDHATIVESKYRKGSNENTLLHDLCDMIGECNLMKPGRDYAQFCWWMRAIARDLLPQIINQTIDASVDSVFLNNKAFDQGGSLSWSGHPCVRPPKGRMCKSYPTNSVVKMISDISKSNILQDRGRFSPSYNSESKLYLLSYGFPN